MADRTPMQRRLIRWLADPPLAAGAYLLYGLMALLPVDWASALGASLLRGVGPLLRADRIARHNLARIFPEKTKPEIDRIVRGMWDNLGRVLGEWPHLDKLFRSGFAGRAEIVGGEHLKEIAKADGPHICITGHYGNWEVAGSMMGLFGRPLTVIYRPTQNRWVNALVLRARRAFTGGQLPKGKDAAAGGLSVLRRGGGLGVLIDQKLNEGVAVPFLGREAMTSPVAARLALRFRCPVVPIRAERSHGAHYRVTVYPPLELPDSGDRRRDQTELMTAMNRVLEDWVRERPEQWFWVHKRWPD